jgi:hypothetical protein
VAVLVLALGRRSAAWSGGADEPASDETAARTEGIVTPADGAAAPADGAAAPADGAAAPTVAFGGVSLSKERAAAGPTGLGPQPSRPTWMDEARRWRREAHEAARLRRRRAFPVAATTWLVLIVTVAVLALVDAVYGIWFDAYGWTALGILAAGLLVGLVLRRTPRSLVLPLLVSIALVLGTAGTMASLHDGIGRRSWTPQQPVSATYRLGIGDATLDLTQMAAPTEAIALTVDEIAGRVRVISPRDLPVTVVADVRAGTVTVDGEHDGADGWEVTRTVSPPPGATGAPVTVYVHLSDGLVQVLHRG